MRLFGKEIGKKIGIRCHIRVTERREEPMEERAMWIVYNRGEDIEFAECSECGREQEPEITAGRHFYPNACPKCGRAMTNVISAEELDAKSEA